jgi:thiamine pyrophosphokinase
MECPSPTDDLREQPRAEVLPAKLDVLEDLAQEHDREQSPSMRRVLAEQYRTALGVVPGIRAEFRNAVIQILGACGQRVDQVADSANRLDQANGSASGEG